jgi:hypothetical protein
MNERIKQLKEQAMEWVPNQVDPDTKIRLLNAEKFAELIVKEMLVTCEEHPAWTGRMIGEEIKQHFGVEDRAVPILSADEQALFAGITSSKLFTIAGAKKHFGVEE